MEGGVERLARFVENSTRVEEVGGGGEERVYDLNSTCALISPRIIFPIFIFRILSIADIPSGERLVVWTQTPEIFVCYCETICR